MKIGLKDKLFFRTFSFMAVTKQMEHAIRNETTPVGIYLRKALAL